MRGSVKITAAASLFFVLIVISCDIASACTVRTRQDCIAVAGGDLECGYQVCLSVGEGGEWSACVEEAIGTACTGGVCCRGFCNSNGCCGNGVTEAANGEQCDDGNEYERDACKNDCTPNVCGDGVVRLRYEVCDGTDLDTDGDGSDASCKTLGFEGGTLACRSDCTGFDTSDCQECGDGIISGNEQCDGLNLDGKRCQDFGFTGGRLACDRSCSFDTSGCYNQFCGDGVINGTEECEPPHTAFPPRGVRCNGSCMLEDCPAETCDGLDNDCDGVADDNLGTTTCGLGICNHTVPNCEGGRVPVCNPYEGATREVCNGLDDDCDGVVDDGVKNRCVNYDNCTTYETCDRCQSAPPEVCDGRDNNCNREVDENFPDKGGACDGDDSDSCAHGTWQCKQTGDGLICVGDAQVDEVCDGADNDCDREVDEGFGQLSCGVGECYVTTDECVNGEVQDCIPGSPQDEICDGKDNDCDGKIDNMKPRDCGPQTETGECSFGFETCRNGVWGACVGAVWPTDETCDGKDNDCDGVVDDNLGTTTCGLGICNHTVPNCEGGRTPVCNPYEGAMREVCNGLDDDCDGRTDEGLGTTTCGEGACAHRIEVCKDGVLQQCDPMQGAEKEICGDGIDNDCDGLTDETCPPVPPPLKSAGGPCVKGDKRFSMNGVVIDAVGWSNDIVGYEGSVLIDDITANELETSISSYAYSAENGRFTRPSTRAIDFTPGAVEAPVSARDTWSFIKTDLNGDSIADLFAMNGGNFASFDRAGPLAPISYVTKLTSNAIGEWPTQAVSLFALDADLDGVDDVVVANLDNSQVGIDVIKYGGKAPVFAKRNFVTTGASYEIVGGAEGRFCRIGGADAEGAMFLLRRKAGQKGGYMTQLAYFCPSEGFFNDPAAPTHLSSLIPFSNEKAGYSLAVNGRTVAVAVKDAEADEYEILHATLSQDMAIDAGKIRTVKLPDAARRISAIALADVDGSGFADLIAGTAPAPVSGIGAEILPSNEDALHLFLADGGGAFSEGMVLMDDGWPYKVTTADVDGNGIADILVLFFSESSYNHPRFEGIANWDDEGVKLTYSREAGAFIGKFDDDESCLPDIDIPEPDDEDVEKKDEEPAVVVTDAPLGEEITQQGGMVSMGLKACKITCYPEETVRLTIPCKEAAEESGLVRDLNLSDSRVKDIVLYQTSGYSANAYDPYVGLSREVVPEGGEIMGAFAVEDEAVKSKLATKGKDLSSDGEYIANPSVLRVVSTDPLELEYTCPFVPMSYRGEFPIEAKFRAEGSAVLNSPSADKDLQLEPGSEISLVGDYQIETKAYQVRGGGGCSLIE